eukprot:SAG11_NODE_6544_length_1291_cov_1.237416_1_plen_31_part_10
MLWHRVLAAQFGCARRQAETVKVIYNSKLSF